MSEAYENRWESAHEALAQRMILMQDDFMHAVFRDRGCVQAVLREIFDDPSLEIEYSWTQEKLENFFGKGTRLDVLAIGKNGIVYNIEVQRNIYKANPERARYYGSMIDTKILERGSPYSHLPPVYVIFITAGDMFMGGKPIYTFQRTSYSDGRLFRDGSCMMYLNSRMQDETTRIGRLMHDFTTADPEKIYNEVLKTRIRDIKLIGKDGKSDMCKELDDLVRKEKEENNKEIAMRMHNDGIDDERIARYTNASVEQVKAWLR